MDKKAQQEKVLSLKVPPFEIKHVEAWLFHLDAVLSINDNDVKYNFIISIIPFPVLTQFGEYAGGFGQWTGYTVLKNKLIEFSKKMQQCA